MRAPTCAMRGTCQRWSGRTYRVCTVKPCSASLFVYIPRPKPPLKVFPGKVCTKNMAPSDVSVYIPGMYSARAGERGRGLGWGNVGRQSLRDFVGLRPPTSPPACGGLAQSQKEEKLKQAWLLFFLPLAERRRFELRIPFWSIHAFQACNLSRLKDRSPPIYKWRSFGFAGNAQK